MLVWLDRGKVVHHFIVGHYRQEVWGEKKEQILTFAKMNKTRRKRRTF